MAQRSLSRQLWSGIEDVYLAILEHPFLRGLIAGTLPRDAFLFYVIQDAHYLRDYARALAVCAARAPAEADIQMFAEHAAGAVAVERELHQSFFADAGITEAQVTHTPMAPTCLAYTSVLPASVYGGSFPDALGAVLPCYWIYQQVGAELAGRGSPDPLYQRWIDRRHGRHCFDLESDSPFDPTPAPRPGPNGGTRRVVTRVGSCVGCGQAAIKDEFHYCVK